jgi:Spy/CpxP family protein refolding chaperone
MRHQHAIGLTEDQQTAIRTEMRQMMAQFTDLQWQESAEVESLMAVLKNDQPDEKQALAGLDKLLEIENQIKRLRVSMLIKIKSLLAPEQQARLRDLTRVGVPQSKVVK